MISKRAKKFIREANPTIRGVAKMDGLQYFNEEIAIFIANLAEEDARERSIIAHAKSCNMWKDGICDFSGHTCDGNCKYMNKFKESIDTK